VDEFLVTDIGSVWVCLRTGGDSLFDGKQIWAEKKLAQIKPDSSAEKQVTVRSGLS
jgi:hypothetical protein